jgi:organic radical activating enzyme
MSYSLNLETINIVPTLRCNLKCRLCNAFSPYYRSPYHPTLDLLIKQADKVFSVVDKANRFIISGGEPLVRSDLAVWVEYLAKYHAQIGRLDLNTNGTIMPTEKLLLALCNFPGTVRILVDDYGAQTSPIAQDVYNAFANTLAETAVVELRDYSSENAHFGGWVDFGVFDLSKISRKSDTEAITARRTCGNTKLGLALNISNGVMYQCLRHYWLVQNGVISAAQTVNFFDKSLSDDDICNQISAFFNDLRESCHYCNGLQEGAPVRYRAGEQMSNAEQYSAWNAHVI